MRTRGLLAIAGLGMLAYGGLQFWRLGVSDMADALLWLGGGLVVHDLLVAPLTIVATVLLARVVPPSVRAPVVAAAVVLATVTVTAVPVLGGWGARPDNPTLLDRDYLAGWSVFASLVLAGMIVGMAIRRRRARRDAGAR